MTAPEIAEALGPLFLFLTKETLTGAQWEQYALALEDVNPGDLDDAITDLRKTHAFRNAPLPAEILRRCDEAKRQRVSALPSDPPPIVADAKDGDWRTSTIPGLGSLRMHVLPDDHAALKRYACGVCHDTGFVESFQTAPNGFMPVARRKGVELVPIHGETRAYLSRCGCVPTNPALQQQRQRQARYVKERPHATRHPE